MLHGAKYNILGHVLQPGLVKSPACILQALLLTRDTSASQKEQHICNQCPSKLPPRTDEVPVLCQKQALCEGTHLGGVCENELSAKRSK